MDRPDMLELARILSVPWRVKGREDSDHTEVRKFADGQWAVMNGSFMLTDDGRWLLYVAVKEGGHGDAVYLGSRDAAFERAHRFAVSPQEVPGPRITVDRQEQPGDWMNIRLDGRVAGSAHSDLVRALGL